MRPPMIHLAPALVLLAVLGGCRYTELNPTHCANQQGDATCVELHGDERPYCEWGDGVCRSGDAAIKGCVAARPTDECYSPCGGTMRLEEDASCLDDVASSSSGDESSTGEESTGSTTDEMTGSTTTGPMPCVDDEECTDGAAPFCGAEGECVGCDAVADGDAACAELDAMAPLCVEAECVACTGDDTSVCDAQLLLCDQGTNACAPCTEHEQCDSGACELAAGTCFDPINVLDVGMGQTHASIAAALDEVEGMGLDAAVLRLHDGTDFNETATIASGRLAFIAAEGQDPQWVNTSTMSPTLTVTGADTRVYVEGVRLAQNGNDVGLLVDGATVDIRRSRIVQNSGGGIVANNGATLSVRNCFVGGSVNVTGIEVNSSSANVLYSTVTASTFGSTPALGCTSAIAVNVRNSIVLSQGGTSPDELVCEGAVVTNTATEAETPPFDSNWFVNYDVGDFHLSAMAPLSLNAAVWTTGDPLTDIDGDARPSTDGTPDIAGADVPQ